MGQRVWISMHPKNFGSHVTVRPSVCTTSILIWNNSINGYNSRFCFWEIAWPLGLLEGVFLSREERNGFVKEMSSSFALIKPFHETTTTVYNRSACYPSLRFTLSLQSAVRILHTVCILPLVCSLQSAVHSLRFTLTAWITLNKLSATTTNVSWIHSNTEKNPQITLLKTNHATADKRTHALLTETPFNHQLSIKQQSNVTTITLLKHTSDSQKTPSKLDTETTLRHFVTQNTGTLRNSVNMSGPWKTTTLTILFHGVSFHLAHPTIF